MIEPIDLICPYCDEIFEDVDEHFEHVTICENSTELWGGI